MTPFSASLLLKVVATETLSTTASAARRRIRCRSRSPSGIRAARDLRGDLWVSAWGTPFRSRSGAHLAAVAAGREQRQERRIRQGHFGQADTAQRVEHRPVDALPVA